MQALAAIRRDAALRLAAFAIFGFAAGIAVLAPYQSLVALRTIGLSDAAYSAVLVAGSLVAVLAAVAVGILTDRLGNRRTMAVVAALAWFAGPLAIWVVPEPAVYVAAHVILLPLGGSLFGQIFVLARLASPGGAEREAIMAAIRAVFALPFILILPLWSLVVAAGLALIHVYAFMAVCALAVLVAILRNWPRDTGVGSGGLGTDLVSALRALSQPAILVRLMAIGLVKSSVGIYMVVLGPILTAAGRPDSDVALFAALVAGLEIPVMLAAGRLPGRVTKATLIAAATLFHAAFLIGFAAFAAHPAVWLLAIPAAIGAGIILSVPIGYVQDLMADRPGAGGALIALHQFAGDAVMGLLFALGTGLSGYGLAAVLGAGATLTGGVLLVALDRGRGLAPVEEAVGRVGK